MRRTHVTSGLKVVSGMHAYRKVQVLLLALVLMLLSTGPRASAEESFQGFATSSMILNTKAKQGEQVSTSFTLFNDSTEDVKVTLQVKDFEKKGTQLIYKDDVPATFSVRKWSAIDPDAVIPAGGKKDFQLTVNVPKDAELGEHSALVSAMFSPNSAASAGKNSVKMSTELLPVLYVVVTDESGTINLDRQWTLNGVSHASINPDTVSFHTANTGNVHVESAGKLTATSLFGKTYETEIPTVNLLPKNEKEILVEWAPPSSFDIYTVKYEFTMDGQDVKTGSFTVYMINWTYVLVGAACILVVVVLPTMLIIRSRKRYKLLEARIAAMSQGPQSPSQ